MRRILLTVLCALTLGGTARAEPPAALTLVTGDDFTPFSDQGMVGGGLATEIVTKAFARAGLQVRVVREPWSQGYARALSAEVDGTFPYYPTPEREAEMLYSEPIFVTAQKVFWNQRHARPIHDLDDLSGASLCLPMGYAPPPDIIDLIRDGLIRRVQPDDMTDCFRLLRDGGVDYVVTSVHQANERMSAVNIALSDTGISNFTLDRSTLHLIVSRSLPQGPAILRAFNSALAEMMADGTYETIVGHFLGAEALRRARFSYPP